MFIQAERTPSPATLKFLPGRPVMEKGTANFTDAEMARRLPLATDLFGLDGVSGVYLGADFITVTKSDDKDWEIMKPHILGAIMDHFQSGKPVIEEPDAEVAGPEETGAEAAISVQIKELIDTRIRPAAAQDGGDVTFREFKDGVVYLEFHGSAFSLMMGIENMLRTYVPEVEAVKDHRDALPKPGLETPEGEAIQELLERRVNPSRGRPWRAYIPRRCQGRYGLYPARRRMPGMWHGRRDFETRGGNGNPASGPGHHQRAGRDRSCRRLQSILSAGQGRHEPPLGCVSFLQHDHPSPGQLTGPAPAGTIAMKVLLVSTYELGHQPFGLASPAAWLERVRIRQNRKGIPKGRGM